MQRLISLCIFFLLVLAISAQNNLFKDGKTEYDILLSADASVSEKTAAKELSDYVKQISGATLQVKTAQPFSFGGKHIYVGWTAKTGAAKPADVDESFTYQTIGNDLYIWGGKNRGTMYGVFSFLEQQLGVHWYTPDFTKVPNMKYWSIPVLNHHESPAIPNRLVYYHSSLNDNKWCAHNRLNNQNFTHRNEYGGLSAFNSTHSFLVYIKPEKYFKSNPEYYSLRNGKRINNGQLCLSNKNLVKLMSERVIANIKNFPDYWVYDVSQMDNELYCQCKNCANLANKYGGQSGLVLWFVNQVADNVRKVYPDKYIGTFAYHYTRKAPKNIKPADNVVIRLCDIECCVAHPIESCSENKAFMNDLEEWRKLTPNIYIWDYVFNPWQYLAPFPDFKSITTNIRTFKKYNVIGLMSQGQYESSWAEFSELKQWLLAQLQWNPEQNADLLIHQFIQDYYGSAALTVEKYFNLCSSLVTPATHFDVTLRFTNKLFSSQFVNKALPLVEQMLKESKGDKVLRKRINRVAAQVYFLYICMNYSGAKKNGIYSKLTSILDADPTYLREPKYDMGKYLKFIGY